MRNLTKDPIIKATLKRVEEHQTAPMTHGNYVAALDGLAQCRDNLPLGAEFDPVRNVLHDLKNDIDRHRVDLFLGATSEQDVLAILGAEQ